MLSAIVPTHERPTALAECLRTLMAQDVAPEELEVVVVDDGSESDIAAAVAAVCAEGPFAVRCERRPLSGLNAARNRGAEVARGEILAYLDDDTLVSPGWANALLQAFASYPCAAVGGRVKLRLAAPEPDWLAEVRAALAEYDLGEEPCWLAQHPEPIAVPVGANCAVRRSEFDRVGGFLPGLDRQGRSLISNGDSEFVLRLRAAGGRLRYEPGASVLHCVPAERLTVSYAIRRFYAQGVSDELTHRLRGHTADVAHVVSLARGLGAAGKKICRDGVRGRGTAAGRFWASYWAGRLVTLGRRPPMPDRTEEITPTPPVASPRRASP